MLWLLCKIGHANILYCYNSCLHASIVSSGRRGSRKGYQKRKPLDGETIGKFFIEDIIKDMKGSFTWFHNSENVLIFTIQVGDLKKEIITKFTYSL